MQELSEIKKKIVLNLHNQPEEMKLLYFQSLILVKLLKYNLHKVSLYHIQSPIINLPILKKYLVQTYIFKRKKTEICKRKSIILCPVGLEMSFTFYFIFC